MSVEKKRHKPKKSKQSNSGKALSAKKREQMFQIFLECGTLQTIMEKLKVCRPTVTKYRKLDKWDDRVEKIKSKAAEIADSKQINRLASSIEVVRMSKEKLIDDINLTGLNSNRRVADLDTLIRLEEFLRGSPDSRTGVVNEDLKNLSTAQLLAIQKDLQQNDNPRNRKHGN